MLTCSLAHSRTRSLAHFLVNAQPVRNPVDVVEIRYHLRRVVDGAVVEPGSAERVNVGLVYRGRGPGELGREVAEGAVCRGQRGLRVIAGDLVNPRMVRDLGPEVVGVFTGSVVTPVGSGYDDREHLPLGPRKRRVAEHDVTIQIEARLQDRRVDPLDLEDVEDLPRAPNGRIINAPQQPGRTI